MRGTLLDTAGWFAAHNPRKSRHADTLAAYRGWMEQELPLVTTNIVFGDMQILLSR